MRARSLVAGAAAGAAVVVAARRRRTGRREHVDLYLADGTTVSLERTPGAERLLAAAREGLAAARG